MLTFLLSLLLGTALANEPSKLDCLAGVCLGEPLADTSTATVVVSGYKWVRSVEECSGEVVEISISAGGYTDAGKEIAYRTSKKVHWNFSSSGNLSETKDTRVLLYKGLAELGWSTLGLSRTVSVSGFPRPYFADLVFWKNPDVNGTRALVTVSQSEFVSPAASFGAEYWSVLELSTAHPDREALCRGKRLEGL